MAAVFLAPGRYIQGENVLAKMGEYVLNLGSRFFVLITHSGAKRVGGAIEAGLSSYGFGFVFEMFGGECTQAEIDRVARRYAVSGCDAIIGAGGGKLLDTAKAAAQAAGSPVIIIPTVAASDAPCSALSVIYTEEGVVERLLVLKSNPDIVLVDSAVIARAPARMLSAGMGDALATWFECAATQASDAAKHAGNRITLAASAIARQCYDTLLRDGEAALRAVENGICTEALENIIEVNILLSGLGFESGGTAAAHPIHDGFTELPRCHHLYHGEKVAFSTLVQLVMQGADSDLLRELFTFCRSIDLPVTLADLGLVDATAEEIRTVARVSMNPKGTMGNMPFPVTEQMVCDAIWNTDAIMRGYIEEEQKSGQS